MNKQLEFDKKYMRMAYVWAENSYAVRRKVGCLIVKDRMIISDGYNGTPSGFENECEDKEYYYSPGPSCINPDGCARGKDGTCKGCNSAVKCGEYLVTKPYVLHAEANAITKLAKGTVSSVGATLYVTTSPCMECSKLIIQAGIKRVVYCEEYHVTDGLDILRRAGIVVEKLTL